MAQRDYSFLDIAVLDEVRERFAAGDALILLSSDLDAVLWANGPGAELVGYRDIEAVMGAEAGLPLAARRQVMATPGFPTIGRDRPLALRLSTGMGSRLVSFHASSLTLPAGETALLLAAPLAQAGSRTPEEIGARAIAGFGDAGHMVALLEESGRIVAASAGFGDLPIEPETVSALLAEAAVADDRLVKRLVAAKDQSLPAGMARLRDEPLLCLFVVVRDPILGAEDAQPTVAAASEAEEESAGRAPEAATESDLPPSPGESDSAMTKSEAAPDRASETAAKGRPAGGDDDRWYFNAGDGASQPNSSRADDEGVTVPTPGTATSANGRLPAARAAGPVRFVWRTDAEGRFSAMSDEFATAVGSGAADVVGRSFREIAAAWGFDPDGEIAGLLERRDTWSGRSVLWPVADTDLRIPVDLAALPVYGRGRTFEGFRGFGVARAADAVIDPEARGLRLSEPAEAQSEERAIDTVTMETDLPSPEETSERPSPPPKDRSDKIIQLAEHRAGPEKGLSALERSAFREIGDRLKRDSGLGASDSERPSLRGDNDHTAAPEAPVAETAEPQPSTMATGDGARMSSQDAGEDARPTGIAAGAVAETVPDAESGGADAAETPSAAAPPAEPGAVPQPDDVAVAADDANAPLAAAEEVITPPSPPEQPADADTERREPPGGTPSAAAQADFIPSAFATGAGEMRPAVDTSILDKLPVPVLIHSGDTLHYANHDFLEFTAYDSVAQLAAHGGLDALFGEPYRGERDGERTERKLRLRRGDGLELPVEARLQAVPWNGGKALLLALRKVGRTPILPTMPLGAEEKAELEARIAELGTIIDTATDGVVLIAADGTIRSISRPAEALFGVDDADVAGTPFASLFAIESQRAARDYLNGLSENGVASVLNDGREVIGRESQGRFIPLFMTIGRLPNHSGYCAVLRDITQWKRAEEELTQSRAQAERASSQKTEFLARVSHEIRTPLNAIIGFSELMMDEKFGPIGNDRYRDYLRDINRSGNHVLDLVNDLLDISKIEAGEQEMSYEAVSLNDTLAEMVATMQPQANRERVIIRSSFASRLPEVVADLRSVRQIALNLLSNAIRFTQAGGQVVVSTAYEPSGDVVMRVRDTGIGMTSAEIDQALKPFKQISALRRGRSDGTGLGLPLTKAMVEANRARFSINSTPGEGTLVEIVFPSTRVLAE